MDDESQIQLPSGFSLVQPQAAAPSQDQDAGPKLPPGFSLVQPQSQTQDAAPPQKTGLSDVGRGTNRGLIEGVGSLLGLPGDTAHFIDKGSVYALTKGAEQLGIISPESGQAFRNHRDAAEDSGVQHQLRSEAITGHLMNLANKLGIDTSQPTTGAGQAAGTVASFVPQALSMGTGSIGGLAKAVGKYAVLPGLASEAAGNAAQGTAAEPYVRAGAAALTMAPELAIAGARSIANPVGKALGSLSPQEEHAAQALLDQSRAVNHPLTVNEAVDKVTGKSTGIGDISRVVEQSPKGGAIMKPFFAQRPAQTEALGRSTMDQISSPIGANPYEVAPRVQNAAQGVVSATDKARTAAVDPYYKAAATDTVPAQDMEGFLSKIDGIIGKDKTGLLSPQLVKLRDALTESPADLKNGVPRVPVTDIENLDTARKYFRDQIAQPAVAQDAIPKQVGARMGSLLSELDGLMEQHSQDFKLGKQTYQQISKDSVDPLLRSPTGQLAGAEQFPQQQQILFNPRPLAGSQFAVGRAVRDVAASDPDAAEQLVRQHIEQTFNTAMKEPQGGPNQWAGAKFKSMLLGDPQQAKNIEAAVTALPNGQLKWNAMKNAMDIFDAVGTRQPIGSKTSYNQQIEKYIAYGHPASQFLAEAASPGRWASAMQRMYQHFAYGQNTAELAKVFTQGNVSDLRRLAGAPSRTLAGQAALVAALARQGAMSTPDQQP